MAGVIYKVKSLKDLKHNMDIFNISPEEAWKLIYGQKKLNMPAKSVWKMRRFQWYIYLRVEEFYNVAIRYQKEKNIHRNQIIKSSKNLKILSKLLPKRINSIRKLVESKLFKDGYKSFNKNKKLDDRAEHQKLAKLIADPRQDKWFHPIFYKNSKGSFAETGLGHIIKFIR